MTNTESQKCAYRKKFAMKTGEIFLHLDTSFSDIFIKHKLDSRCNFLLFRVSSVRKRNPVWQSAGDAITLGISMVVAIGLGALLGYWLDSIFGTFPKLSIVCFIFGLGAAGSNVWKAYRKAMRMYEQDQEPDEKK